MEICWPDADPQAALRSLRVALHAARRAVEPELAPRATSSYLIGEGALLRLAPHTVWIDADEAERLAEAALAHGGRAELTAALDAFTGELLPEDRVRAVVPPPPGATGRAAGEDPPRTGRRPSRSGRHRGSGGGSRANPGGLTRRGVRPPRPDRGVPPAGASPPGGAPVPPVPGGTGRGDRGAAGRRDGSAVPPSPRRADLGRPVGTAGAAGGGAATTRPAAARPGRRAGRAAGGREQAGPPRHRRGRPRQDAPRCRGGPPGCRKGGGRAVGRRPRRGRAPAVRPVRGGG